VIVIDRFEGDSAILEKGSQLVTVDRRLLCEFAREGDIVEESDGRYVVNAAATAERRQKIADRMKKMGL
jgi:hypothetical protein